MLEKQENKIIKLEVSSVDWA